MKVIQSLAKYLFHCIMNGVIINDVLECAFPFRYYLTRMNKHIQKIEYSDMPFNLADDIFVGLCYVMPEGSSRFNAEERSVFDRLLDSVAFIHNSTNGKCNIILSGDFNSRTSDNPDFVSLDTNEPYACLPDDYSADAFYPRFSQDKGHSNSNGVAFIDFCKQTGLRILNGRIGEDAGIGKYTFVGHRGCSLVDYVIVSETVYPFFTSFVVHDPNPLSDHCLIECVCENNINLQNHQPVYDVNDDGYVTIDSKYIWNTELKENYISALSDDVVADKLSDLTIKTRNAVSLNDIESNLFDFGNILHSVTDNLFKKNIGKKNDKAITKKNNVWFDDDCEVKRNDFMLFLNRYRNCKTDENRVLLVKARSDYKTALKSAKRKYNIDRTKTLETYRRTNAKLYWNMLKDASHVKAPNIPLSSFETYFKAVNNPDDHFFNPDEDVLYFNERFVNNEFHVMFGELDVPISNIEIEDRKKVQVLI
jgi:hypothetical protein